MTLDNSSKRKWEEYHHTKTGSRKKFTAAAAENHAWSVSAHVESHTSAPLENHTSAREGRREDRGGESPMFGVGN
jgi:hypothetical protein